MTELFSIHQAKPGIVVAANLVRITIFVMLRTPFISHFFFIIRYDNL
jgi:hypothetical protein